MPRNLPATFYGANLDMHKHETPCAASTDKFSFDMQSTTNVLFLCPKEIFNVYLLIALVKVALWPVQLHQQHTNTKL